MAAAMWAHSAYSQNTLKVTVKEEGSGSCSLPQKKKLYPNKLNISGIVFLLLCKYRYYF